MMSWRKTWLKTFSILLLSVLIGVWRFDIAYLPSGLIPLDPKGLAYVSTQVHTSDPSDPRYWLGRTRQSLTDQAKQVFSPDEASLLSGILYGEREMSKPLKDDFRRAGLLHIMAVSGSNVTIVVALAVIFLMSLSLSRRASFYGLTLALIAFVLFVSPSASVVRAAIMGWLIALAPIVGRIARPSRLLLISAVAFTLWQPWALFFDAGFALSFLAMWGLLTWGKYFDERLEKIVKWKNLRLLISASLGATLMTAPYTAWAFGQFSIWGLLTGVLALPLVPWIMALGALALFMPVSVFILPTKGFLSLLIQVARLPHLTSFGWWPNLSTSWMLMGSFYLAFGLIWFYLQRKKRLILNPVYDFCPSPDDVGAR